jgi:hypothetical protein
VEEKYFKCSTCEMGEVISETFEESTDGERVGTYYYSCGHRVHIMIAPPAIHLHEATASTKLKSGEKIENKSRYEIEEMCKKDDMDDPNQYVSKIYYKNRENSPHEVFQVIQYASGEIKHVHCKTCNSEYRYNSTEKLEDLFHIDFTSRNKIECLHCHAKFEQ